MHAQLFRERAETGDVYGRLKDDWFAFFMPKDRFVEDDFMDAVNKIETAFSNKFFQLQINMGAYEIIDSTEAVSGMVDKCNLAIETIKNDYSRQIAYFDTELLKKELVKNQLIKEFEQALVQEQIQIFLQAQTTADGGLLGAEALARWLHLDRGLISPNEFIPIIESVGLIYKLDRYVWEMAVRQLAAWKKNGKENLYILVDISVQDQYYLDVYDVFTKLVEKYHIDPHKLKLEITETIFVTEVENHTHMIEDLQAYGFEIEIDDFGSGYSSLNILKDIKADVVKIDMGFLRETANAERSHAVLQTMIH